MKPTILEARWETVARADAPAARVLCEAIEFETTAADSRTSITAQWEDGWSRVFAAVGALSAEDLSRTVRVRGEPHTVLEAVTRQLTHYAAHVGQIVLLAKHYAGPNWQTLSIPRGKSKEVDVSKSGGSYGVKGEN